MHALSICSFFKGLLFSACVFRNFCGDRSSCFSFMCLLWNQTVLSLLKIFYKYFMKSKFFFQRSSYINTVNDEFHVLRKFCLLYQNFILKIFYRCFFGQSAILWEIYTFLTTKYISYLIIGILYCLIYVFIYVYRCLQICFKLFCSFMLKYPIKLSGIIKTKKINYFCINKHL